MKDIEDDVQLLVGELKKHVGATLRAASKREAGTPWTAAQSDRGQAPWREVEATMTAGGGQQVGTFIAVTARRLTASYYGFIP